MAWVFGLAAECGSQQAATNLAQYFADTTWTLSNGLPSQCQTATFQDAEENWWCRVCPSGLSQIGMDTAESAYLMTETGILLYQKLLGSPEFRYALVGIEVDEFRTYSELLADRATIGFSGLVMNATVAAAIQLSPAFQPFRSGYFWKPYEGEVYRPLMASPELKTQMSQLLTAA